MTPRRAARRRLTDLALALGAGVLDVAAFSTAGANLDGADPRSWPPAALLGYGLLGASALVWRRRQPVAVLAAAILHALVGTVLVAGYQPVVVLLVAVYTVGAYRPVRSGWLIAPAVLPFAVIAVNEAWRAERAAGPLPDGATPADRFWPVLGALLVIYLLLLAGVWGAGCWAGLNRRRLAAAQRQRAEAAARAVRAERLRVSGELHDIVANAVTVMMLQAGGARAVMARDPDRARAALDQVTAQGGQAIAELRRLLALLQDEPDPPVAAPGPVAGAGAERPTADPVRAVGEIAAVGASTATGLAALPALLDRFRATGLSVDYVQAGPLRAVDPSIELAVYRAVQEALTNVLRHAGAAARADVRVCWGDTDLAVSVRDHGPATAPDQVPAVDLAGLSTGNGLAGLRERLRLLDGELTAGGDGDGFTVAVRLPVRPAVAEQVMA
ncbi:ATPase [Catellatospora methionotrophica]|uniref:histidine kinase n=1 Tax=Catellatospora methionotrophica TaxID=121620 RepID=A0A8J3LLH1_9ACTN|nr:histidine kinase [Catellatospora methionotrophica]GIG16780.1 ATPase [Catellatospora methionotrophica]